MSKLRFVLPLMFMFASSANAGFFDSFFGGDKEAEKPAKAESAPASEASASESSASSTLTDAAIGLLPTLMGELNVDKKQATGGMGALMEMAQDNLSKGEFSTLSAGVPGMDSLLAAAPALANSGLGGALSGIGGSASALTALSGITGLNQQFESLGLSSDMVLKFANIAIQYFSTQGGDTSALLEKGLGSILG